MSAQVNLKCTWQIGVYVSGVQFGVQFVLRIFHTFIAESLAVSVFQIQIK